MINRAARAWARQSVKRKAAKSGKTLLAGGASGFAYHLPTFDYQHAQGLAERGNHNFYGSIYSLMHTQERWMKLETQEF